MKTSYFANTRNIDKSKYCPIGIAQYPPKWLPAIATYLPLAPTRKLFHSKLELKAYRAVFMKQLAELDPERVRKELKAIHGALEPVLLCYEAPPFDAQNFCHRRMVARWWEEQTGEPVPELVVQPKNQPKRKRQLDLFD